MVDIVKLVFECIVECDFECADDVGEFLADDLYHFYDTGENSIDWKFVKSEKCDD